MNEMKALAELGVALDPPTAGPPDRLRRQVMTEATRAPGWSWARLHRVMVPRVTIPRLAVTAGLAAAVTAVILVSQVVQVGNHPATSTASASDILRGAAAYAQRQPALEIGGDRFVYVESIASSRGVPAGEGGTGSTTFASRQRQIWLSANGTRDGLLRERPKGTAGDWLNQPLPGCQNGFITQTKGTQTVRDRCTATAGYHADLPTDVDAMLAYLRQHGASTKNGPDQDAFTLAGDLVREAYLAPAALAALFNAVAKIPGVTVVGQVTDDAGRAGVAVSLTEVQGNKMELIFDQKTFTYLGERSVLVRDQDGLKAGQVIDSAAVLKVAVVANAGQLP